jgi:two-component system CheB/CheR fusion protein
LESELAETRDFVQSVQEQHEAANEELQASNEEVQSTNEELQSINEELETSKEELESANEELTTVNEEMAGRYAELNRLNSDLVNIQNSAFMAIVLLGRDLTIRRFTTEAEKHFNLLASDVGRSITQVRHNLIFEERRAPAGANFSDLRDPAVERRQSTELAVHHFGMSGPLFELENFVAGVIADVQEHQIEVRDKEGRWYSLRVRPYLTRDNQVDGAVLVLVDVNELKRNEQALAASRDYAEAIIRAAPDPLIILESNLHVHRANDVFYATFKLSRAESEGRLIYELGNREWQISALRHLLEGILPNHIFFADFEITHQFESIGRRTMVINACRLAGTVGQPTRIMLGIRDATSSKLAEEALRDADRHKNEFLALLAHELRNPLAPIRNAVEILQLKGGEGEAVRSVSSMMERQVSHMVRLVDDLLDVSRINQGKIELRKVRVELATIVKYAVEAARPQIETSRLDLIVTSPPQPVYLNADPVRMAQVLGNLLNNACKFTGEGGRAWLTVEVEGKEAAQVSDSSQEAREDRRSAAKAAKTSTQDRQAGTPRAIIRVRDSGIGIAPDKLQTIFGMFHSS